jgi:hypothetical protein
MALAYNKSMGAGRPSVRTPEVEDSLLEHIAHGGSLADWCEQEGNPGYTTVMRWRDEIPEFREKYTRAREDQGDFYAERIVSVAESCPTDFAEVQRAKLLIDTYKWAAGKRKPKVYGDKLNVEQNGAVEVRVSYATPEKSSLDE